MSDTEAQMELNDVRNHLANNCVDHDASKTMEFGDASQDLKKEDDEDREDKGKDGLNLKYAIDDIPPWYSCLAFGLQQHLTMFSSCLVYPVLMINMFCVSKEDESLVMGQLFSAVVFSEAVGTFLQSTFGSRLPIIQGVAVSLYIPATIIMKMPQWQCRDLNQTEIYTVSVNDTSNPEYNDPSNEVTYSQRIREIQGATLVASCFQLLLGFSGVIGLLLRYIGPLTVAPTLMMIGLGLSYLALMNASDHWGIAFMTMGLVVVFSQYLRNINVLYPWCKFKERKCYTDSSKVFALFPVLFSIIITWLFCLILTIADVFPDDPNETGYRARTDVNSKAVADFPWFWFPVPFRWGMPTVSVAAIIGMSAGVIASVIESIGDYHACAMMSGAPPIPDHAINRGIGMEGVACMVAGMWGSIGVTSYSGNIGAIAITKVGSRRVIQWTSFILIVFAFVGKIGALVVSLPSPIVGGVFWILAGLILSVGVSNLQYVNMNSTRNLCILGLSIASGVIIPEYFERNPDAINTGSVEGDQILTIVGKTGMLIAGLTGFILDNTVPGSLEERGMTEWRNRHKQKQKKNYDTNRPRKQTYDLPFCMPCIRKVKFFRYLPFCPTFREKTREEQTAV
ncbi:solute carrier family 23 member 1-like isoform X1 [Ptychodera flava]|uniref:solute carrier family 23 member 1-like isoform X1 n=1 Tax=Ptychodera flava TaxID=63121 RepID=UPI00396A96EB